MTKYYSQNGEDFLLDKIFKDKKKGFFVEVGCIDGKRFSNTLSFEKRGWEGLCVEAHSGYIECLIKNRPNSIICHCAVGEKDRKKVNFFANSRGSLSTLDSSQESNFRKKYGKYFTGFEEQSVAQKSLNTIFEQYNITKIDILSIDIEGYEIKALKGLDFEKYRPLVLVVEADSPEHERQLDNLLNPKGYLKSVKVSGNIFYFTDPTNMNIIENKIFEAEVIHTEHPLDNDGDKLVTIKINTRKNKQNQKGLLKKCLKWRTSSKKNESLIPNERLEGLRIFATTVIRNSKSHSLSGHLIEIDWLTNKVKSRLPIPLDTRDALWNPRGGNRGGRGVFLHEGTLYVATATSVLKYDNKLHQIGELTSPYLAGLHEIFIDNDGIWLTSTIHDIIIKLDFKGKVLDEWRGSESKLLQQTFNFTNRNINLNLDFLHDISVTEYEQYCSEERLHLNTVWKYNNSVYVFSCSKKSLIKIRPEPEQIILVDNELSSPHNGIITLDGRVIVNDTGNQSIRIYDLSSGKRIKTFPTNVYPEKQSIQFAKAGWQRGLTHVRDSIYLIGTSPSTVYEIDINNGVIGQICKIDSEVRHCIHGLTAVWNF